jgi:hypothetical protein
MAFASTRVLGDIHTSHHLFHPAHPAILAIPPYFKQIPELPHAVHPFKLPHHLGRLFHEFLVGDFAGRYFFLQFRGDRFTRPLILLGFSSG